jgi:formylglycine-generating enzyme required for sulfatase activity
VHEIKLADRKVSLLTPTNYQDVDFFDACYLPNGKVIVCSTAGYQGIPCVSGGSPSCGLYLLDPVTQTIRQLTFDQDNDYSPRVLNDGRVMYLRWEYSDIPHYFSRRLMTMNPDGIGQLALYGSNGLFPTGFRLARPVPGKTTLLAGIISGHHECGEFGRMALLDPALATHYPFRFYPTSKSWGTRETEMPEGGRPKPTPEIQQETPCVVIPELLPADQTGWLQLIPGYGKTVAGVVCDVIVRDYYAKQEPVLTVSAGGLPAAESAFYRNVTRNTILTTHPYPLSDKYFLVSQKNRDGDLWGIYLVDVFDNATLLAEKEGAALFEPIPLRAIERPPVIPDRVIPASKTADVHIADIYAGPGLRGVPRGTVSRLRVFSYHFGYNNKAVPAVVGTQSGWDIKRVLGTAVIEKDGSAHFQIPANTPVSIQPLDREGQAVQLMRSWLAGMPGERVSCVGCHEGRATTLPLQRSIASQRTAEPLTPWYGGPRPFAFAQEVYPVLAKACVGCHGGEPLVGPKSKPSFKDADSAYDGLRPYVHVPAMESDMALLTPMEYHASTSPLVQMLRKGHHGVTWAALGGEARERIACWIDLNAPRRGLWSPPDHAGLNQAQRRRELAERFSGVNDDPEAEGQVAAERLRGDGPIRFVPSPAEEPVRPDGLKAPGFPMTADEARRLQETSGAPACRSVDLGGGVSMTLARIPAGAFVMGSLDGAPDERPRAVVRVDKAFWMGICEVNNSQYAAFDLAHDTRYVDMHGINRVTPGYIANHPEQPVSRVSWDEAMRFCAWLSRKTGLKVTLPSEAQWEWAARAGTETPFFYGTQETDYSRFANLADRALRWFDTTWEGRGSLLQKRYAYSENNNFPLRDERFIDNWFVVDTCGRTEATAWGLKDMVGNVSEWTRTDYRPYPYADDDRNAVSLCARKVARGGSWADRPADAGSSVRRAYEPWQKVFNVGFRVIVEFKNYE